jgi:hypothetical protein
MPADCEIEECGVLAVGRCVTCKCAFCGSHQAISPNIGHPLMVNQCAPCLAAQEQARIEQFKRGKKERIERNRENALSRDPHYAPPLHGEDSRSNLRIVAAARIHRVVNALLAAGSPGLAQEIMMESPVSRSSKRTKLMVVPLDTPIWMVGEHHTSSGTLSLVGVTQHARLAVIGRADVVKYRGRDTKKRIAMVYPIEDREISGGHKAVEKIADTLEAIAATHDVSIPKDLEG